MWRRGAATAAPAAPINQSIRPWCANTWSPATCSRPASPAHTATTCVPRGRRSRCTSSAPSITASHWSRRLTLVCDWSAVKSLEAAVVLRAQWPAMYGPEAKYNFYLRLLVEFMINKSTSTILYKITLAAVEILWKKTKKHTNRILDRNFYNIIRSDHPFWSISDRSVLVNPGMTIFGSIKGLDCCPFRPFRSTAGFSVNLSLTYKSWSWLLCAVIKQKKNINSDDLQALAWFQT